MKIRSTWMIAVITAAVSLLGFAFKYNEDITAEASRQFKEESGLLYEQSVKLEKAISLLDTALSGLEHVKEIYAGARKHYKLMEIWCEYYAPATAKLINGPLVPRVNEEEGVQDVFDPEGLQVIEEILYSDDTGQQLETLKRESKRLKASCFRLTMISAVQQMANWQLPDAARQEIIRVMTLNIIGFDVPASGNAMIETANSLRGVKKCYELFADRLKHRNRTLKLFDEAIAYLETHTDFDSFNRMYFIRNYANLLYSELTRAISLSGFERPPLAEAIVYQEQSIFSGHAFSASFFAPGYQKYSAEAEQLGRLLFFDPILSGSNERSCASCHDPVRAFSDGRATSVAFGAQKNLTRNAPGLINVGYQASYFWDSRVTFLEEQVSTVTEHPDEMHGNFKEVSARLHASAEYRQLFKKAFRGTADTVITAESIQKAIAAYERSLSSFNAPFDRYMRGDNNAMSADEVAGFNLFMGKALCGTCHFMPLFNGTVPPVYARTEWEIIGVPSTNDTINVSVDADEGRSLVKNMQLHRFAFKTPGLRNAALTAPYMHNGVYQTLEQVIDFYNRGGAAGMGADLPGQTLPPDKLALTAQEQRQLVLFIHSLTDTAGLTTRPARLPVIDDMPSVNTRKIGGSY